LFHQQLQHKSQHRLLLAVQAFWLVRLAHLLWKGLLGLVQCWNQRLFEHCSSCGWIVRAATTALTGTEDLLLGDATTDAILSAASDSVAGVGEVADSLLVAAGEVGAGALSIVPSWLLLGRLAALASELAFAVIALFVLLQAGGIVASEIVRSDVSKDSDLPMNAEIVNISGEEDTEGMMEEVTESKSTKTLAK
jgi:hypothetical protein